MNNKHKPCPFCGSIDIRDEEDEDGELHYMLCEDCHATGPTSPVNCVGGRWLWNVRTEQKAEAAND